MDILKGTDLGIFSVSKAENQAVQTELVCFVERIQQEAVQFFQGRVLYHKGALRNVGLIISVHFHRIEDGFVLHGPKSKHVCTSNRMIIASANHLAYEGTLVKPGFLLWRVTIPVEKLIGSALIEQNSLRQSGKDIVKQETFEVLLTSDVRKKLFVIAREQATMLAAWLDLCPKVIYTQIWTWPNIFSSQFAGGIISNRLTWFWNIAVGKF